MLEDIAPPVVFGLVIAVVVSFHYEALYFLATAQHRLKVSARLRIVAGVVGAIFAHMLEVWMFALAYFLLLKEETWGQLAGPFDGTFEDCVYFSFTVYTTLGFGDIQPVGDMRHLTGIEALTGIVMITWTASFLYLEMQRYWSER